MIELENHPWIEPILSEIKDPTLPIDESNPVWEYIDSTIASMGTIRHGQIDIEKIQQNALILLKESKDVRLIAHLLRTLQHAKKPQNILLAIYLLSIYIAKYWLISAPQPKLKARLFKQIIQRFSQANKIFDEEATIIEKQLAYNYLLSIKQFFDENDLVCDEEFSQLLITYQRFSLQPPNSKDENKVSSSEDKYTNKKEIINDIKSKSNPEFQVPLQSVNINHETQVEWKRTLIKVAEILFDKHPENPISIRLRRHAIFYSLAEPLNNNDITDLMPVPIDRINEYKANISKTTIQQWAKIENELTLMPFWLEGHFISANMACHLGFNSVAEAILDELLVLLNRLPKLYDLKYSDHTPFISDNMKKWLTSKNSHSQNLQTDLEQVIFECYKQKGLEAAIQLLEENSYSNDLRDNYYYQKINAQLLKHAGFEIIAKQQALSILTACKNMTLTEWEPSFIETLIQLTKIKN
ncbi:MAG: type VI secretion system protein TssA [Gilliamella sp.]|uniref:type VI secretion system protein TssA n=1 Tax=Gilliamella sp. TaxID=1891236 RepID=UPI0025D2FDA2|nr:type VI secretion system protein TssA [Gilliamella sp.]MCO6538087.1 type VI secretion system protein TssA [Gilliamella sp.]MCO6540254.1 type VI secretion system protein TssA [Gilliamella sp.]